MMFHKFSFLTGFITLPVFVMCGYVAFGDEGSRVMSVDSFMGDCALSGLFIGVMLTVSSGTVKTVERLFLWVSGTRRNCRFRRSLHPSSVVTS